jgi:hydrogenase nickel incorporation protein HypB
VRAAEPEETHAETETGGVEGRAAPPAHRRCCQGRPLDERAARGNQPRALPQAPPSRPQLSSPGSGKTALLERTIADSRGRLRIGVVVGDLATENDANRLRKHGAQVVQITTGTVCHLDSAMVARALQSLDLAALDVLVIENVGNLVCPASYDLGEDLRVVLLATTEGEDKPLKYPPVFSGADVVVVNKTDLAAAAGFDRETALRNIRRTAPKAVILELSAKTGQGVEAWIALLEKRLAVARKIR